MRPLRQSACLLYVALRSAWRMLPCSWRCAVRRYWQRKPLVAELVVLPHRLLRLAWRRTPYPWRRGIHGVLHPHPPAELRRAICDELRRRQQAGPGPGVLFLPLLSWFECGFQRPHQMARALASAGCPVVFYEPWKIGRGGQSHLALAADADRQRQFVGLRALSERLQLLRVPPWLLAECLVEAPCDFLVMVWPYQAKFIPRESPSAVVYDVVDDHELLPAAAWWRRTHQRWLRRAELVTATAESLAASIRQVRSDCLLLPNGVRLEDWATEPPPAPPDDMRDARKAPVVVAYYGAIGPWFDWDLWLAAAAARPHWAFLLIGFAYGIDDLKLRRRAERRANVFYLGPKPHAELPRYMAFVDVATIPFKLNPITHACSPLKLFEFMAAGKPIVAAPMREILKYRSVLVADGPEAFVQQLDQALGKRNDPAYLATLKAEAEANTWRSRALALREAMEAVGSRRRGAAGRKASP